MRVHSVLLYCLRIVCAGCHPKTSLNALSSHPLTTGISPPGCTACCCCCCCSQEMHEFNMEDTSRVAWDPMLRKAWLLQSGKAVEQTAEQLVVYLRR